MSIHPAIVITCDGHRCAGKLALIGADAASYRGARAHAETYGWDCSTEDLDWCPDCSAAQAVLDTPLRNNATR